MPVECGDEPLRCGLCGVQTARMRWVTGGIGGVSTDSLFSEDDYMHTQRALYEFGCRHSKVDHDLHDNYYVFLLADVFK